MPITKIILENFKGIRDRVEIPLRPITLLFGGNSAGKSTILQALLYFKEILQRQNSNADQLSGSGTAIDLGGFRQFVHKHELDRKIRIGVECTIDDDGLRTYPTSDFRPFSKHSDWPEKEILTSEGITGVDLVYVEITIEWYSNHQCPYITEYRVELNGEEVGLISAAPGYDVHLRRINTRHSLFETQFGTAEDEIEERENEISTRLEAVIEGTDYIGPLGFFEGSFPLYGSVVPEWGQPLNFAYDRTGEEGDHAEMIGLPFVEYLFSQLMVAPGELLLDCLTNIRYLGAIRAIPPRSFRPILSPTEDRWANGMAAWDLLRTDRNVEKWLDEKAIQGLGLGYCVDVQSYFEVQGDSILGAAIEAMRSTGQMDMLEDLHPSVASEIAQIEKKTRIRLVTEDGSLEVEPADVGIGVSQVLPVAIGAMAPGYSILSVEQPELHLHPAIQCNLGDIFIKALRSSDERSFLLETHSEHLLLRLMKRVRQTTNGDLPDKKLALKAEEISVIFVETHDGRSVFREMPINKNGELIKAWPGGFFEEDLDELM